MGLANIRLVHAQDMGNSFSFYILYGTTAISVDVQAIHVPEVETPLLDFWEINELIERELKKKVVVVAATIGTDAHTVGLDAIISAKGFGGESGLERYPQVKVYNLGAQVPPEVVIDSCKKNKAEVVLVSQVVTQRNSHLLNLSYLSELLEAEKLRERLILICGGPYINAQVAFETGFDAGFGPGTTPLQVASYIVQELLRRKSKK
jgi:beta-lysine 5,6-aminomutase beta subunit